jgi:hypothetical protein
VPPHHRAIIAELRERAPPFFEHLTKHEQLDLREAIYTIDMAASSAARSLRTSPWSADELFSLEPPQNARTKRQRERWANFREHQYCLNMCERARTALFQGNWGKAIHDALYAGYHLNGASARSASRSAQGLLRPAQSETAAQRRAKEYHETILQEAVQLRTRHPTWSLTNIAKAIEKKHERQVKFPRWEAVRKKLSRARKSGTSALQSQE